MDNEELKNNINESLSNFVDDRPTAQEMADEFSKAYMEAMKDPHFASMMEMSDKVAENVRNKRPRFWGIDILQVMGWLDG